MLREVLINWEQIDPMARQFYPDDYNQIKEWFLAHNIEAIPKELLPINGLIVDGLAAGFLITTDNGVGILEFFISNPKSDSGLRDTALDLIIEGLLERAKTLGLKFVMARTDHDAVKRRAYKFDFINHGRFDSFSRGISNG